MEVRIILIEGKRANYPTFYAGLTRKGLEVVVVSSGTEAISLLNKVKPQLVVINAASMRTTGRRISKSIHQLNPRLPIVLIVDAHTKNTKQIDANIVLKLPFTLQKLLNRIKLLAPPKEKDLLITGPIKLDIENQWVRRHDKHASLTPRLVILLRALMGQPGEVFERKELFRLVWETEYTGDTRTLDVHISWLRQAIEDNPRHPTYIKTVRGVGYRLDIEPHSPDDKSS